MTDDNAPKKQHIFYTLYQDVLFAAHCKGQGNALLVHFENEPAMQKAKLEFEKKYQLSLDKAVVVGLEHSIWLPTHIFLEGADGKETALRTPETVFLEQWPFQRKSYFLEAENLDDLNKKIEDFFHERLRTTHFINRGRTAN